MSTKTDDPADYLIEQARQTGMACATTKDGHILIFRKDQLTQLLQKIEESGRDVGLVFIKRQDFNNAS